MSKNMSYAMSPSSKRMMAKQSMKSSGYVANQTIPTPNHVSQAKQTPNNMNYGGGQYAQQSNQPNKYRVAHKPQQPTAQQMMYQQ
jgi:hypothetical protein